jgi:cardiolipin synthase
MMTDVPAYPRSELDGEQATSEPPLSLAIRPDDEGSAASRVALLDGGKQAYPRMLRAIGAASHTVRLEVYAFSAHGVGACFLDALSAAATRGVDVDVVIDGWGSARDGRVVVEILTAAGCSVHTHNRLRAALTGRVGRNHRKVLLVDDEIAFIGGLNIGDENLGDGLRPGWADLSVELHGAPCRRLGRMLRGETHGPAVGDTRIYLCGLGGGWRLRRRYVKAIEQARVRIRLAHGYFLPDAGIVRALIAAARRGVDVRLLLAGCSDVPLARAATRRLHRRLLAAGVLIHEWRESTLHAKVATIDGGRFLVGSFNLDPFSLANWEALVEVEDAVVVGEAAAWIDEHCARGPQETLVQADTTARRWVLDPAGHVISRIVVQLSLLMASRRRRRP